ncbi:MAG: alkaline phosphatase family protein [Pelagibacteraceae bacterium TMED124]|nr:MAG: alkaline phosphatase family protein [Pelagibacteraceae bacterium TMED124]
MIYLFLCIFLKISFSDNYVLLVSFDGFRYDYMQHIDTPNFDKVKKNGVKAESLIPIFPSLTFPNHYSIATGCYANKHKIISNHFYSKRLDKMYSMYNRTSVIDSSFYGCEPIWVTAEKNNIKSASYFWVGSEATGKTPSIYKKYDSAISFTSRIDSVMSWFRLPKKDRPNLVLLYFSEPDHTGHMFGPKSMETEDIITQSDQLLGYLLAQIDLLDIKDKLDLIIVSDHGMSSVTKDKIIFIDDFLPKEKVDYGRGGSILFVDKKRKGFSKRKIYKHTEFIEHMNVYKKDKIPSQYNFINEDSPDFLFVAHEGWFITDRNNYKKVGKTLNGMHGYDPSFKNMHGIFYAKGPSFKVNQSIKSFENIHVYPLICKILNIDSGYSDIDGDLNKVKVILR